MAQTVETACPACGHSPIPEEAERCPSCHAAFKVARGQVRHADREVPIERSGTMIGGLDLLTSDAEANPGTAAASLAVIGLYAGALGLRIVPGSAGPNGHVLLACAEIALAIALQWMPGFARPLVIVSAPLQCAAWLYLGRDALLSVATLGLAAAPILVLVAVTGETGPRRRSVILAVVLALTAFAFTAGRMQRGPGPQLRAADGLALQLPSGFEPVQHLDALAAYLPIRGLDPRLHGYGFRDPSAGVGGVWTLSAPGSTTPERLAAAAAQQLDADDGDDTDSRRVRADLEGLDGLAQVTYEVPLGDGRAAAATAVQLPGERVALLVIGAPAERLELARQAIARGTEFSAGNRR